MTMTVNKPSISQVIDEMLVKIVEKRVQEILSGDLEALPAAKPSVMYIQKKRRPRRTYSQLKAAFVKAMEAVKGEHPSWAKNRQARRARTLVAQYVY